MSAGTLAHEVLHQLGRYDEEIQSLWGLTVDRHNTGNITDTIEKECL